MSATHNRSGSSEAKFLPTRSGAACWREMRWVVLILLPRRQPLSFANRAIKGATYRWSDDGRKSCLYEPPMTRNPRRYHVYEGFTSDLSATQIPLMCRRLYGEVWMTGPRFLYQPL